MHMMIIQIQKAAYGRSQIIDVQKNRASTSPNPLAIPHQPSHRPREVRTVGRGDRGLLHLGYLSPIDYEAHLSAETAT
jgi:hypothetical protein